MDKCCHRTTPAFGDTRLSYLDCSGAADSSAAAASEMASCHRQKGKKGETSLAEGRSTFGVVDLRLNDKWTEEFKVRREDRKPATQPLEWPSICNVTAKQRAPRRWDYTNEAGDKSNGSAQAAPARRNKKEDGWHTQAGPALMRFPLLSLTPN
ncbi:hypothetical protein Q8A73_003694 [Channa argus]|nr:hypothetical protein Q8A73_003694 [Channa argus]